jgi:UDP-GlcNAc:undecaprenyl-phosphate GlcNAc-1-phosphate transferase
MFEAWLGFALSGITALWLTRVSIALAPALGLVDLPDARKVHSGTIALAGWAMVVAALFGTIASLHFSRELTGLWLGSLIAALTGLADDWRGLHPKAKALGQFLAALTAIILSPWAITSLSFFGYTLNLGWLAVPFTIFWIMGAINSLNLIDGLDGLAAGVTALIASACALLAWQNGNFTFMALALIISATTLGFLTQNFSPARAFMGDTGSHFLGYWLSILTVQATQTSLNVPAQVPLLVSLCLLGLPIADTVWAIWRRLRAHQAITEADRGHIHYRLLAKGWSCTKTVIVLYVIVGILSLLAIGFFQFSKPIL